MEHDIEGYRENLILVMNFSAKKHATLQFAEPEKIKRVQTRLFLRHLEYTPARSPFYKVKYSENNIDITGIKRLEDIKHLPLIGIHMLSILMVTGFFRLNMVVAIGTGQLCMPPFVPALCIEMGYFLTHGGRFLTDISFETLGHQFLERFYEYCLGGRRLAQPLVYFSLYFVVFYYIAFFPSVKQRDAPYLKKRFPRASQFRQFFHRYQWMLSLGKTLIDRAILEILGPGTFLASFDNQEEFDTIQSLDSGFIILMSHVGCWRLAMSALTHLNRPVNLLILQNKEDIDKHYYEHGNQEKRFNIINPVQFLGGTIVILHSYKSGPGTYKITLPRIIQIPPKQGKEKKKMYPFIQDHPYQFFNFYDMWEPEESFGKQDENNDLQGDGDV